MIKVNIVKSSNYPVSSVALRRKLKEFFKNKGIVSDSVVDVAIVGEEKMLNVAKNYLNDNKLHNVLSFSSSETKGKFIQPPADYIYLGEIIICFPKAKEEANNENKLIEDKVIELATHGALHLLGIHHD